MVSGCGFAIWMNQHSRKWMTFVRSINGKLHYLIMIFLIFSVIIIGRDCRGLQEEFNTSEELMESKHEQGLSADKHLELMNFLNSEMQALDCY